LGKDTATQANSSQNADFHESLQLNKTIQAFLAGLVTNFTTWFADCQDRVDPIDWTPRHPLE
jgi:hypothetical protein